MYMIWPWTFSVKSELRLAIHQALWPQVSTDSFAVLITAALPERASDVGAMEPQRVIRCRPWPGKMGRWSLPSGKLTTNDGKSTLFMGKSTINGYKWPFSIAVLVYQRVYNVGETVRFKPPIRMGMVTTCTWKWWWLGTWV